MCFHDNLSKRITIAIDGPAGAGKSTLARRIAAKLGFVYVDTGAMYRAVALWALRTNVAVSDMHRLEQLANAAHIEFVPGDSVVLLNNEDVSEAIRTPEVSQAASEVSLVPAVRRALVEKQREIGGQVSVVMEGRDIGTVVFPEATVKIFLDALPEERATRRATQSALPAEIWWSNKSASATSVTADAPNRRWCRRPTRSIWTPPGSASTKWKRPF